jgi:hypothetical protein
MPMAQGKTANLVVRSGRFGTAQFWKKAVTLTSFQAGSLLVDKRMSA